MKKLIRTPRDLEKLIWDELLKEFNKTESLKEMERLFNILTSVQEREIISRRLAVISLIKKGDSYKEISRKLWVSPLTISTIKKSMFNNDGYKSYHWMKKENTKEVTPNIYSEDKIESALNQIMNHIVFMIENRPRKNGPRWRFANYGKK